MTLAALSHASPPPQQQDQMAIHRAGIIEQRQRRMEQKNYLEK